MVTRTVNRGTAVLTREPCPPASVGTLFQKCQEKMMTSLPKNAIISTKRGTASMKVSKYPKMDSNLPNWGFIVTSRGTATHRN